MKTDLTIILADEIANLGGTVIVLPTRDKSDIIPSTSLTTTVRVSNRLSIVIFNYPKDGNYVYRFDVEGSNNPDLNRITTKRIGVGSGGFLDIKSNNFINIEEIETIMISGRDSSEAKSIADSAKLTDILRSGVDCTEFDRARVCVAK